MDLYGAEWMSTNNATNNKTAPQISLGSGGEHPPLFVHGLHGLHFYHTIDLFLMQVIVHGQHFPWRVSVFAPVVGDHFSDGVVQ